MSKLLWEDSAASGGDNRVTPFFNMTTLERYATQLDNIYNDRTLTNAARVVKYTETQNKLNKYISKNKIKIYGSF